MVGICHEYSRSRTCRYGTRCKFAHVSSEVKSTGQKSNNGNKERVHEVQDYYNPLELFFAQYPSFDYGREASSSQEFYRMCDTFNWDREDLERQDAHEEFKTALVKQFSQIYGTEVEDIQAWRGLCLALEILPLPGDVREAKEVFRRVFVNLVDLVDTSSTGQPVVQFDTLEELQKYTVKHGKYFPKNSAYAGVGNADVVEVATDGSRVTLFVWRDVA